MPNPLRVYYPHGGIHFMLVWWTHDEQNHVILARSLEGLSVAARRVFQSNPDAVIKEARKIEIVAPSDSTYAAAAKRQRKEVIVDFVRTVSYTLMESATASLPNLFQKCDSFKPTRKNEKEDEDHWNCKNCVNGIQLVGISRAKFYDKFHEKWYTAFPVHDYDVGAVDSRAEKALDGEVLSVALPAEGHHNLGIFVQDEFYFDCHPTCISALFYFRHLKNLDVSTHQHTLDAFREEAEKKREEGRKLVDAAYDKERIEKLKKALGVFRGN